MTNKPSIVLGTWSWGTGVAGGDQVFGNHLGEKELRPVFEEAMKNGLNLWDSAVVYGMGASETLLSTFTREYPRNEVLVSTKFTPQIANEKAESRSGDAGRKPASFWYRLYRYLLDSQSG